MIDKQKILEKLRLIKENLVKLQSLQRVPVTRFIEDFEKYDSAKYNLQTAIEAMLDICNHIISRNVYDIPHTNADAFRILCQKKILDSNMEETFTAMARFRNRVVHLYWHIDNREVYRFISEGLDDFESFIVDITRFLASEEYQFRL